MSELAQFVADHVTSNGGTVAYTALYEATPPESRAILLKAVKEAEKLGAVWREVKHDAETGLTFVVHQGSRP